MVLDTVNVITLILIIIALVFVVWQFVNMILSKKLNRREKGLWAVLFFVASLLTAIVWFIVKRAK